MNAADFDLFGVGLAQFETWLLVFVRVSVMLSLIPIFSATQVPIQVRFGLGLFLSFVVGRIVPTIAPLDGLGGLTAAIASQALVGAAFGFVAFLVFTGVQFAGEILDVMIGFGAVNIINPTTQAQVTIVGELELALATLIYLAGDAHHFLIAGIGGSFSLVPLPFAQAQPALAQDLVEFFTRALFLVFEIAAPIAIALLLTNIALALMSRVAPQINVFAVGFPLQILVGLTMMLVSMPLLGAVLPAIYAQTPHQLDAVLRRLAVSP